MKVSPISSDAAHTAANAFRTWPRGMYDFEVVSAIDTTSKAGNAMTELELRIHNKEGKSRTQKDWLVESEATSYKVRHFAASTGLLPMYEKGDLPAEAMVGRAGKLMLGIEKDKGGVYPDKNKVSDYIPMNGKLIGSADPELDDAIPF